MRDMLLLGAGASFEADVPLAYEMSERIAEEFQQSESIHSHVLSYVIGGLLFQQGRKGVNPYNGINVEELFNAVQLLAERHNLEVTPFVGAWDEVVDKLDRAIASTPDIKVSDLAEHFDYFLQSYGSYRS